MINQGARGCNGCTASGALPCRGSRLSAGLLVWWTDLGVAVTRDEVLGLFEEVEVEAVAVGCPHCSGAELAELADLLRGKTTTKPFYVFVSRGVAEKHRDLVAVIERSGARIVPDTCMVVSPRMDEFSSIMVDSGKAFAYVPGMCGAVARIGTREECVEVATG